jgi:hypothetical protein
MLWNAAPFRMRHRGITAIGAGAKNEQWLALEAVGLRAPRQPDSTRCIRLTVKENFLSAGAAQLKAPRGAFFFPAQSFQ